MSSAPWVPVAFGDYRREGAYPMNNSNDDDALRPRGKAYATPRLVCYGSVKDLIQGGGGTKKDTDNQNTKSCWVAEALYGVHDPRTALIRAWLPWAAAHSRGWRCFAAVYSGCGRFVAALVHRGYIPRSLVRPLFDALLVRAIDDSARAIRSTAY
jgi:hypothetical protein